MPAHDATPPDRPDFATPGDIDLLRNDLGHLNGRVDDLRGEMKEMRADMKEQMADLRGEMAELRTEMKEMRVAIADINVTLAKLLTLVETQGETLKRLDATSAEHTRALHSLDKRLSRLEWLTGLAVAAAIALATVVALPVSREYLLRFLLGG